VFEFSIQKSYSSDELLLSFFSDSRNNGFREALKTIMEPHGFNCKFDEYHIYIDMVRGDRKLKHLTISSDEWCVFGETNTWGKNLELNHELIDWLKSQLLNSGYFKIKEKTT